MRRYAIGEFQFATWTETCVFGSPEGSLYGPGSARWAVSVVVEVVEECA